MNLVVDCSFFMSSILPDESQTKTDEIFYRIAQNELQIYVPSIFYLECSNVLISSLKRQRITQEDFEEYINLLGQMPIIVDKFSTTTESLYSIGSIARKYNLSSYDASYLDLAIRLEAPVASLDKKLLAACATSNIKLALET